MPKANISFFTFCPGGDIQVDDSVMGSIQDSDIARLSIAERNFLTYYRRRKAEGMTQLILMSAPGAHPFDQPILDVCQEKLCEELIRMIQAPDLQDLEVFPNGHR